MVGKVITYFHKDLYKKNSTQIQCMVLSSVMPPPTRTLTL